MAQLALTLFGTYAVTCAGEPVTGAIPVKGRALLAYLAVEVARPHPREVLAELLWPDHGPQVARDSLRDTLARLRLALGERTAAVPLLLITRDTIQWHAAADCARDVADFTALLAACTTHPHPRIERCGSCMRRLAQVAALYRGDFLQQFTVGDSAAFEEWAAVQRERLRGQALEALAHLAAYHEHRGAYGPAQGYAERQVALDPWGEDAHRQVLRLLAYRGQRGAALDHYERCRRILMEDLGVEPAEETTRLAVHIRAGTLPPPPPPATRHAPLPVQLTSFIGREEERAGLARRLDDPGCRLVTLTGPGGVGKTRLAVQVALDLADDFADGVAVVALAPIRDPQLVGATIAQVLGVTERGDQPLLDRLKAVLQHKQLLLLVDNVEHVLAAAPLLAELLAAAPALKILATSRAVLHLSGEQEYAVPPLQLPTLAEGLAVDHVAQSPAVRLFTERAQAVTSDFVLTEANVPAVAAVCVHLDGLPLAIELAATWSKLLPPQALLTRLIGTDAQPSLQLLTGGARDLPARQHTMRATIDWSYHLLTSAEQQLFARLAVFVDGWTLHAAEAVCTVSDDLGVDVLDGLQSLVDKSLVRREVVGAPTVRDQPEHRFHCLETIRAYAHERLAASADAPVIARRHAAYYLAQAEAAAPAVAGPEHGQWVTRLERDHHNLRAALHWSFAAHETEVSLRLVTALARFWHDHGYLSEGYRWWDRAVSLPDPVAPAVRAKALLAARSFTHLASTRAPLEESLGLFEALGDTGGVAHALHALGRCEESLALFRALGDTHGIAESLQALGCDRRSEELLTHALTLYRALGDMGAIALTLEQYGGVLRDTGDYARAAALFEEGLELAQRVGNQPQQAWILHSWGELALLQGDDVGAQVRADKSLALFGQMGNTRGTACVLHNLGYVAQHRGEIEQMAACFAQSLQLFQAVGAPMGCLAGVAGVAGVAVHRQLRGGTGVLAQRGRDGRRAARLFGAVAALGEANTLLMWRTHQVEIARNVARARALLDDATWDAAWADGQALTLEQAISEALTATP